MPLTSTDALAAAFRASREILARVDAASLGEPTPCKSWDVRALINHMIGAPRFATSLVTGAPADGANVDFASGDFVRFHDETSGAALAAFGAAGTLDTTLTLPFGERPARFLMLFVATDQLTHAWDLAHATGQPTDIAPDLAAELLAESKLAVTEDMRGPDGAAAFDAAQDSGPRANPADRLAAFLGRNV
jgi:uncharacterized protein (TIGR03086 family)